jgi:hypothetical protein
MQVRTLAAAAGWTWLRDGLSLYRKQPFAFTALVILYTMFVMLVASVPIIGVPVAVVLVPFGTVGLTLAGREAERGVMPMPALMLEPFRNPIQRVGLFRLGCLHSALVIALMIVASLFATDELSNWKVVGGQLDQASVAANVPWDAILVAALLYTPILMLTWFAPMLVAWHRLPVAKSMFFSFVACWRNRWPFLSLGLLLAALAVGVGYASSALMRAVGVSQAVAQLLLAPIALVLTSIAYATQYPIYRSVVEPESASLALDARP